MNEYRIRVRSLGKHFGTSRRSIRDVFRKILSRTSLPISSGAINGIDLQIAPGTITALVGENGSGKSTLLKILARITSPTSGTFSVQGCLVAVLGMDGALHPDFEVEEAVRLQGALCRMTNQQVRERMQAILEFAGLVGEQHKCIKELSAGTRVRLLLSVALFSDWDILLVDETFSALDVEFRWKCEGRILERVGVGASVLVVSHDWDCVLNACHDAIHLHQGKVVGQGPVAQVLENALRQISSLRTRNEPFSLYSTTKNALHPTA